MASNHRGVFFFSSESPTGFRLYDTHFFRREIEQRHQRLVHVIRTLHRTPHRNASLGIELRDHSLWLDVELLLRPSFVFAFHNEIGLNYILDLCDATRAYPDADDAAASIIGRFLDMLALCIRYSAMTLSCETS